MGQGFHGYIVSSKILRICQNPQRAFAPKLSDLSISQKSVRENTIFLRTFGIYIYIPYYIYVYIYHIIYIQRESVLYHVYGCICIYVYYHLYIYMIYHIYIIFIKQQQETNLAPSGRWAAVPCLLGSNPWPRWAKNGFRQGKTADFVAPSCRKMLILWNLMVI